MRLLALLSLLLLPLLTSAAAIKAIAACYVTTNGLHYRTCASTSCASKGTYNKRKVLYIRNYVSGSLVDGNRLWYHLTTGYYVSSVYCQITDVDDNEVAEPF